MAAVLASKIGAETFNQNGTISNGNLKNFASLSTDPSCSNVEFLEKWNKPTIKTTDYEKNIEMNFDSLNSRGRSSSRRTAYGDEESQTTLSLQRRRAQKSIARNGVILN